MSKQEQTEKRGTVSASCSAEVVNLASDIVDDIDRYICDTYGLDRAETVKQNQYNDALLYIYNKYICHIGIKGSKTELSGYEYKNDSILLDVFNIYIRLCMRYNKHICDYGFSCISGIDTDTMERWRFDKKASRTKQEIAKKLVYLSQESLVNNLTDGRINPMGTIAVLNNRHGWSSTRVEHISTENRLENADIVAKICG